MAITTVPQPLKWAGGKSYMASAIIGLMPKHLHYCEPYFGGGSVLLAKDPEGVSEIVGDVNYVLTNFWTVIQAENTFTAFQRIINSTPFSEVEYHAADSRLKKIYEENRVESCDDAGAMVADAVAFFIACRQSYSGSFGSFAPITRRRIRRGMNEQASAWLSIVDQLPAIHARLRRVVVMLGPACKLIRQQDGEATLFYCDPPYVLDTRTVPNHYEFEMTDEQHAELLDTLAHVKGRFLLSGYRSTLYDEWAARHAFRRVDFDQPNQMAAGDEKRRRTECVWLNY